LTDWFREKSPLPRIIKAAPKRKARRSSASVGIMHRQSTDSRTTLRKTDSEETPPDVEIEATAGGVVKSG
jgi:hypothetical protein